MSIRNIYRQIAKMHGVSVAEVKRDLQAAINATYKTPNAAALAVPKKGDKPTPEEFITHAVNRAKETSDSNKH